MQSDQPDKVDGGQSSNSSQKNVLLQQLGLVPSIASPSPTTGSSEGCSNSTVEGEEKADSQAEGEKREEKEKEGTDPFLPADRPQQKNKKKCWNCKTKLELAQRELGTCKCGKRGGLVLVLCVCVCVCVCVCSWKCVLLYSLWSAPVEWLLGEFMYCPKILQALLVLVHCTATVDAA